MKKLLVLILVMSLSAANASIVSPLPNVVPNLDSMLKVEAGRKSFKEMKTAANQKNTDIGIALQNYRIAKSNVNVARAQFNPITTGHVLGMALGVTFLWIPMAVEAVLSIPTKIYGVAKSKHLTDAAYYNLEETRDVINNELAHLYYDILTHEVILKTIDQEIQILNYQEARWTERGVSPARIAEIKKWILSLGKERVDIYSMYVSELAAIRTLVSTTFTDKYELAQVSRELDRSLTADLEEDRIQEFALVNSDKLKASTSSHRASQLNVKQVKWSILSFSGLNFSYRKRIKEAKNEEKIARLKKQYMSIEVKTNILLQLQKLDSSLDLFANYNAISSDSTAFYADTLEASQMGQMTEDAAIEASFGAIRDFRSKVVAHYVAWSALDDFSTSANFDFSERTKTEGSTLQGQVETDPLYRLAESTFKVVKKVSGSSVTLYLSSPQIGTVSSVDYDLEAVKDNKFSDEGRGNYAVYFESEAVAANSTGVAHVRLDNGHEFDVQF